MAAVIAYNLTIHKGTSFEETFNLTDQNGLGLNLTNASAVARLKKHPSATTYYSFSTTITIADSTVKISMAPNVTSTLPSGRCCYDLVITQSGTSSKVIEGSVIVKETVST